MPPPTIVFMGTPEFALASLEACVAMGRVALVVTQPDRPRGRGQKLAAPPVKVWAVDHGLPIAQPEKLKGSTFQAEMSSLAPDLAVVAAYGLILPQAVLDVPRLGCVNVHASLLPRLRGAAPIPWAVAHGDAVTGISLMRLDAGLDTGPVFAQRALTIAPDETGGSLSEKLSVLGAQMLRDELPAYLQGTAVLSPQDHSKATLAPMLSRDDARLDFARAAADLERRVRAFDPVPGAFALFGGTPHKIWRSRVVDEPGEPGVVTRADGDGLVVATGKDALAILELTPPGRRRMAAREFLAGHKIAPGTRLGT